MPQAQQSACIGESISGRQGAGCQDCRFTLAPQRGV